LLDAVFPFDFGIVLVAGIERADGGVILKCHERVALAHGVCIAWAGLRENASQPVDFPQPDGIGDVGVDSLNHAVNVGTLENLSRYITACLGDFRSCVFL